MRNEEPSLRALYTRIESVELGLLNLAVPFADVFALPDF